MPHMILLPSDQSSVSGDWVLGGSPAEGTVHDSLDDDNGDTSFVACDDDGETMIIEFANPSVAEADIVAGSYSVRFLSSGRSTDRRNPADVNISFQVPSGFTEACSYNPSGSYESITGIARASKPGGGLWQYSDIEALEMICAKDGTKNVQLSYLVLRVDYTEAVTGDNATFFGANF